MAARIILTVTNPSLGTWRAVKFKEYLAGPVGRKSSELLPPGPGRLKPASQFSEFSHGKWRLPPKMLLLRNCHVG